MSAVLLQCTFDFDFELRNRRRITGVAVGVDHPRRGMVRSAQRFGEKALSRGRVLLPDGDMVNPQTTLGEQLLDLAPLNSWSETVFCKDKAGYDANCESSSLRGKGRKGELLSFNQSDHD